GSLNMMDIVRAQGRLFWGWLPAWGIVTQPLAFVLFLTAGIAATKRIPFDTPEGESEIIGYFIEYSGMKFGMFAMADFLETVVIAGMTTALFLGGWQVPYLVPDGFRFPWGGAVALPRLLGTLLRVGGSALKAPAVVLAASAIASQAREARGRLAALRGVHDVRDRVPGALHLHRRGRAPEPGDREGSRALRHRSGQVRLLRLLCGGVPGGRDPDGHGDPRVLVLQPGRDDLHEGDAVGTRASRPRRPSDLARADPRGSEAVMAHAA